MAKKRFYIIGIAGVAMATLAGLLKKKGYEVIGSDQEMYEPMKGMLEKLKIPVFTPYQTRNLKTFHLKHQNGDTVIVGNAIGRGNPELEYVMSKGHLYRSMSDILQEEFILGKKPIVITGTHGKTTTTALIAWILECAGFDPTIFVGGFMRNIGSTFKLGKGPYIVLEGDEYDTVFFDKSPKFWHYRPFVGLVNNIELDHVDIYKDLEAYKYAFARFINLIPENGLLVTNAEDKNVMKLMSESKAKFHLKHFGLKRGDYIAKDIQFGPKYTSFDVFHVKQKLFGVKTSLIGKHNISNILGAVATAEFLKISRFHVKRAVETFQGVKRRAEIIAEKHGITIIDDYAHHPTAVRETLKAVKSRFPTYVKASAGKHIKRRLFVIFEPGSASSKRRVFESEYIKAFSLADVVYIYKPFHVEHIKRHEVFNGKYVSRNIRQNGILAKSFDNLENLLFHMKHNVRRGDVVVIMSCRGFDGLREKILETL